MESVISSTPGCADPSWLRREGHGLWVDGFPVKDLAERWGTPLYVYSAAEIQRNVARLVEAFVGLAISLFYAVKANSNGSILRLLCRNGLGAEVVSQGEFLRALRAGFEPGRIVYTGTGKQKAELLLAAERGIQAIVVECPEELEVLHGCAQNVRVALRLNLGLDVDAHPGLTTSTVGVKFGLDREGVDQALSLLYNMPNVKLVGLHTHLGSQIASPSPYLSAFAQLQSMAEGLQKRGFPLEFIDLGGGFALGFPFDQLAEGLRGKEFSGLQLYLEPGRSIVGSAGCLVTRILYVKRVHGRIFAVVDAAMNDFIRPALYGALHPILVDPWRVGELAEVTVVGPVCESTDRFGDYHLPPVQPGDFLVFLNTGAYGFSMSSQYNSRPRPAEVLIAEGQPCLIRARETPDDVIRGEVVPDWLT